jgi:hypothetical protein
MFSDFPQYSPEHFAALTDALDPIDVVDGYSVKHGERFELGPVNGQKVRQCLHVVKNLRADFRGLVTGCGLPSPQGSIVAAVAKYFGLECAVTTPRYRDGMRDFDRINSSLAQRLGATVYGVGNPNPAGFEKDARTLAVQLGFLQIKFGMYARLAMEPVIRQVENVPEHITRVVIVAGSGLCALGVLRGLARFKKRHVKRVDVVTLSRYFRKNRAEVYDTQRAEVFDGETHIHASKWPYRQELRAGPDMDLTYESKAWRWMIEHVEPSESVLFWTVGRRNYDLDLIEQIDWRTSPNEQIVRAIYGQNSRRPRRVAQTT